MDNNINTNTSNIQDSNVILPHGVRNTSQLDTNTPIDMRAKITPVILRSFNKDLATAMAQKQRLISQKENKIIPQAPIAEIPIKPKVQANISDMPIKTQIPTTQPAQITPQVTSQVAPKPLPTTQPAQIAPQVAPQVVSQEQREPVEFRSQVAPKPLPTTQPIQTPQVAISNQEKITTSSSMESVLTQPREEITKLQIEIDNLSVIERTQHLVLFNLTEQENKLTAEITLQETQKNQIKTKLDSVLQQEIDKEELIASIEKETQNIVSVDERHSFETKRWEQEEKRAQIEKNKWTINDEYEKVMDVLEENEQKLKQIHSKKEEINTNLILLLKSKKEKESQIQLKTTNQQIRNKEIQIQLAEINQQKKEIEDAQIEFLNKKKIIDDTLALLKSNAQTVLTERSAAKTDEANAKSLAEKRIFEEKRQNTEVRQRRIEQQRWDAEKELQQIMEKITETNSRIKVIEEKEEEIQKTL